MEYHKILHNSVEIKTIGQLLRKDASIFFNSKVEDFCEYKAADNKTNLERIYKTYIGNEAIINNNKPLADRLLKPGVMLVIPKNKANKIGLFLEGGIRNNPMSDLAFKAQALADLERDKKYERVEIPQLLSRQQGFIQSKYPEVSVWIWCRALSNDQTDNMEGQLIDVSPFIKSITTNVAGENGGNFTISLPPLVCWQDKKQFWSVPKNSIKYFKNENRVNYLSSINLYNQSEYRQINLPLSLGTDFASKFLNRNQFLFHNIIKSNDIVFIRFETLKMEERDRISSELEIALSNQALPGKIYDMIGLVDSNTQAMNFGSLNINTTISGRDLTKILIEDGSYFFPTEYAQIGVEVSSATKKRLTLRLPHTGQLYFLQFWKMPSIEDCLKFVFNNLTSIKIVPDTVFQYYKDNLSFKGIDDEEKNQQNQDNIRKKQALKRECLNLIKSIRFNREMTLVEEEELLKIDSIFDLFVNYITKAYKENLAIQGKGIMPSFVYNGIQVNLLNQLSSSTFSNIYVTKDNFYCDLDNEDLELLLKAIDYIAMTVTEHIFQRSLEKSSGIWSIINLNIDPNVSERIVVDASIATTNGSILNYVKKICRSPFIDFLGDTYGDQYYFTVRVPPFDRRSYISLLSGSYFTKEDSGSLSGQTVIGDVAIITIKDDVVMSESLTMNESEIYTWYQLTPKHLYFGTYKYLAMIYLPIKGFQEYIDIWGSKPYQIEHNYMPYNPNLLEEKPIISSEIEKQTYLDLKYLIETHAYLPFTRKGNIVIAGGDRRIKRGGFIRYQPTHEIYYVDGVQHNYSVDDAGLLNRTTVVQVSRGMVEDYIKGVDIDGTTYSYFDIINTNIDFTKTKQQTRTVKEKITPTTAIVTPKREQDSNTTSPIAGATATEQPTATTSHASKKFINILKSSRGEDFRPIRYRDGSKALKSGQKKLLYTIGYGHQILDSELGKYTALYKMSKAEAEAILDKDIKERNYIVSKTFPNVNQNEFDAIFDFVFNTCKSAEGFHKTYSKLIKAIKTYLSNQTKENLRTLGSLWMKTAITVDGKISDGLNGKEGLVGRRRRQFELFANNQKIYTDKFFTNTTEKFITEVEIAEEQVNIKTITETVFDRDNILSDMKVNPKVFNFFLRGSQFGYEQSE